MSRNFLWILALGTMILVLAGAWSFTREMRAFRLGETRVAALADEARQLSADIRQADRLEQQLSRWKAIRDRALAAGLDPYDTLEFQVDIERLLPWEEVSRLIGLASHGRPRGSAYWYKPSTFSFRQVPGNDPELDEPLRMSMEGAFLVKKPSPGGVGGQSMEWLGVLRRLNEMGFSPGRKDGTVSGPEGETP